MWGPDPSGQVVLQEAGRTDLSWTMCVEITGRSLLQPTLEPDRTAALASSI